MWGLSAATRVSATVAERPGRYRILRGSAEVAAWLEQVVLERVGLEDPEQAARRIVMSPGSLAVLAVLAADNEGRLLLRAAEVQRRRHDLKALCKVVEDPERTNRTCNAPWTVSTGSSAASSQARRYGAAWFRETKWTSLGSAGTAPSTSSS